MKRALFALTLCLTGWLAHPADGSPRTETRVSRASLPCPDAGRAELVVPDGIDGVRVFSAGGRPGAATDITVLSAGSDRTLRASGAGVFGLQLDEPLRGVRFQIALEPVLDAPAGACVSRVELLRGGAVVATAQIR